MGQKLESGLAGEFWFGVSGVVAVRRCLGLQLSEGWTGAPAAEVVHSHAGRCGFLMAFPLDCLLLLFSHSVMSYSL